MVTRFWREENSYFLVGRKVGKLYVGILFLFLQEKKLVCIKSIVGYRKETHLAMVSVPDSDFFSEK
jgi:hypothetical protein